MPRYDYNCEFHGEFEAVSSFADSDLPKPCPHPCGNCKDRGHKVNKTHMHTQYICSTLSPRVARLYAPVLCGAMG